jgi:fumarate reductase flavoprotein subunit
MSNEVKENEDQGVSRRGFLKGAAVVAAAAGGIIAESHVAKAASAGAAKTTQSTLSTADVCIIGGAGAGLIAALSAIEAGAKKVIVLEKMKATGGTTQGIGGLFGIESPVQKRLGIHDTADFCYKHHMNMTNWYCDGKLVRRWLSASGDMIRWLEEKGVQFDNVICFTGPGLVRAYHMTKGSTGATIVKVLMKNCEDKGVEIRTNTRVTKLLTDDSGAVTGVVATQGNEEVKISAKSVIIATGSISSNAALKARFYPGQDMTNVHIMAAAYPHTTGDGLIMAEEIGAASTHISTLFIGPHGHGWNEQTGVLVRRPHLIKINRNGERFVDESMSVNNNWGWMLSLAVDRQPDKVCYAIMDEAMLRGFQKDKKIYAPYETMATKAGDASPTAWLDTIDKDIADEEKLGRIKISKNWDDIAQYIGCDAETLKATIAEYNNYCDKQYDGEFIKDSQFLLPLSTPPYYALKSYSGIDTCIGGLRINHNLQVMNKKILPISGLYAGGVVAGNWLGLGYGWFGSEMSFTAFSGYYAGKHAAEYALKMA